MSSLSTAFSDIKNSFNIVLDHTQVDDEVVGFLMNLKNDESLLPALENTGGNLAELTSDIFVHVRDEDIPNLYEKLKETGFFSQQNPRLEEAFAEKLQQIGNSSNVVKAFKFSAIFCLLFLTATGALMGRLNKWTVLPKTFPTAPCASNTSPGAIIRDGSRK